MNPFDSVYSQHDLQLEPGLNFLKADMFPMVHPIHWLTSHFAVGGWSNLQRLSGMLTAHMTAIAPHNGFTWHPHRGLEIYTYVIEGELYHEDTTGGRGVIRAGEVQRMFSGEFIQHQELNRSDQEARVIQIWYAADPRYRHKQPHYDQIALAAMPAAQRGDATVYTIIGPGEPTQSHVVESRLTATVVPAGGSTTIVLPEETEDLFLYFVKGDGHLRGEHHLDQPIELYDVLIATPDAPAATVTAGTQPLTFLSFYLMPFVMRENRPAKIFVA
jgi:redox-sensitive bicupin YhaK (pirin superfamily)